jgi:mannose-6-phosphate isomerase-like protein (cupin superfamily)
MQMRVMRLDRLTGKDRPRKAAELVCIRMQATVRWQANMSGASTTNSIAGRLVRYRDLRPCTTAFIDTRTPGSERKENFTIIGPGVAENPDQFVHIDIPHTFNIGGARQPPRCVNSQHSHETAEVFMVLSGRWRFLSGERGLDGHVDLEAGDTISLPTHMFRGFENIGDDVGFLFAVLGGDDPGRVTWAPYVFEAARSHGLVLLESGRLIDTTREALPPDAARMPETTAADVANMRRYSSQDLERCVVRFADVPRATSGHDTSIIGQANARLRLNPGPIDWPHGFSLRLRRLAPRTSTNDYRLDTPEVVLGFRGTLNVACGTEQLQIGPGDTLSVPEGTSRQYSNTGADDAYAFVVTAGDMPAPAV